MQAVNAELPRLYWDIGRLIAARQARDLHNPLSEPNGFSERNPDSMVRLAAEYPTLVGISQPPVAKLADDPDPSVSGRPPVGRLVVGRVPCAHNVLLMRKLKDQDVRLWYARQTLEQGWSRDTLAAMIRSAVRARHGAAVTKFSKALGGRGSFGAPPVVGQARDPGAHLSDIVRDNTRRQGSPGPRERRRRAGDLQGAAIEVFFNPLPECCF